MLGPYIKSRGTGNFKRTFLYVQIQNMKNISYFSYLGVLPGGPYVKPRVTKFSGQ